MASVLHYETGCLSVIVTPMGCLLTQRNSKL